MATYSRILLSGSTNGKMIQITQTATPGTLIHTGANGSTSFDEIYFWAVNVSTADTYLSVEWGGVLEPADHLVRLIPIPAKSAPIPIATGQVLNNSLVVRAFTPLGANVINIVGYVNRIVA